MSQENSNQNHDQSPSAPTEADQSAALMQKMIAPAASMGLTWAARKAMTNVYEKKTGTEPPNAADTNVPIGKVLLWAAGVAVVTTLIDTVVNRIVSKKLPDQRS